jgi:putative ABC transport system permease protein
MKISDYIVLGSRNIWRSKVRSFLTIFAVVIGAVSVIIMLSLVIGARNVFTSQIENMGGLTLISISPNPDMESSGSLLDTNQNGDTTIK